MRKPWIGPLLNRSYNIDPTKTQLPGDGHRDMDIHVERDANSPAAPPFNRT